MNNPFSVVVRSLRQRRPSAASARSAGPRRVPAPPAWRRRLARGLFLAARRPASASACPPLSVVAWR